MNSDDDVRQKTGSTHGMTDCDASAATSAAVWRRRGVILPGARGYIGDMRGETDE